MRKADEFKPGTRIDHPEWQIAPCKRHDPLLRHDGRNNSKIVIVFSRAALYMDLCD